MAAPQNDAPPAYDYAMQQQQQDPGEYQYPGDMKHLIPMQQQQQAPQYSPVNTENYGPVSTNNWPAGGGYVPPVNGPPAVNPQQQTVVVVRETDNSASTFVSTYLKVRLGICLGIVAIKVVVIIIVLIVIYS